MVLDGYSVGLYARVKGIDNKKAYRELLDRECFSIQKSNITISLFSANLELFSSFNIFKKVL